MTLLACVGFGDTEKEREREGNSGFHLLPSFVTVLFLRPLQMFSHILSLQGDLDLNLEVPGTFFETWKGFVSCQVASNIGCFYPNNCLTANSSSIEILFLFLLSIAPSLLFCVNDRHSVVYSMLVSSETSAASLGNTYDALLTQYPVETSVKSTSGIRD
ncbi:hypothetical protein V8G54_001236 [Vigna mungo]|uniref:Uncharacterized protein n=1 Tax=Vigna mungo TaxID=3915 RepID=A0AAQ3P8D6_VIGMU